MPEVNRQEPGANPHLYRRASRAEAAVLSRAPPRRGRGHRRATYPARQRSDQSRHAFLEKGARARHRNPGRLRRLKNTAIARNSLWSREEAMHDHQGSQLVQIAPLRPPVQAVSHRHKPHDHLTKFLVGLDVGSTTVKAVVTDAASDQVFWQDYQRHETKQPEKTFEFLKRMEAEVGVSRQNTRMFMTGSGGAGIADQVGAKFVQEVTAVSLAVEKLHPEVYSVIELGGQDAKIIVFKDDDETGRKKKIPSMNDKCAGGTGAVIDKINAKLKIPVEELCEQGYHNIKLHRVAGKCGVFAETDINGLQKVGTPPDELMASLFDAIVLQNLSVLTRGHTLRPHVLLLGGPNSFIRGMREAWQANIPRMWQERKVEIPAGSKPEDLIKVPQNAQYFAALGAIEFGKGEEDCIGCYRGFDQLIHYIEFGRAEEKAKSGGKGLVSNPSELDTFRDTYRRKKFTPASFQKNQTVAGFVGIDGGSTSTKAVLLDQNGDILCKAYQLSNGNPIQDTLEMFENLRGQVEKQNARLEVLGVATTGYAKDILKDVLKADVAL